MADADHPSLSRTLPRRAGLLLVNLWLVYHLAAVIAAPASVAPSSQLARSAWEWFEPYLQALYLNHGYHFFAPEPAESTLVAWTAQRQDGTEVRGRIPNFDIKPRLLYHRHFMLTEFLNFVPDDLRESWHRMYARHVCRKFEAEQVSLSRVTHFLPSMEMVREGTTLANPESYAEQPLGTFQCDEF